MKNETATQAYTRNMDEIAAMMQVISQKLAEQNANLENGRKAHWGNVGDVAYIAERIKDIHDQLTGQGEYAK